MDTDILTFILSFVYYEVNQSVRKEAMGWGDSRQHLNPQNMTNTDLEKITNKLQGLIKEDPDDKDVYYNSGVIDCIEVVSKLKKE
jgi:hypothetical protein